MGGWRVHGVGGGGVGGWRVHGVGAYTHPPMNSYNVKIFNFMNSQPPTHQTYPKCHSGVALMGWVVVGSLECSWGGWLEGSWCG